MERNWSQLVFDFVFRFQDGGELEVRSSIGDALRWERNHGGKSFVESAPAMTDLIWLGWAAAKRKALTDLDFESFAATLDDVAADPVSWDGSDGLDPTQKEHSPEPSLG